MDKIDSRTVGRYINKGLIKKEDYQKHLDELPDLESEATWVHMDLHDTELGEDVSDDDSDTP